MNNGKLLAVHTRSLTEVDGDRVRNLSKLQVGNLVYSKVCRSGCLDLRAEDNVDG